MAWMEGSLPAWVLSLQQALPGSHQLLLPGLAFFHNCTIKRETQNTSHIKLQKSRATLTEMFNNLIIHFQGI